MHATAPAPVRIEVAVRVRFDEAGPDGLLRSSGLLRYVQDVAWIHSEGAGFGRDWYGARGLMWLVRAVELQVLGVAEYGSSLTVTTEVIGFRRVWARRKSKVHRGDGAGGARSPVATVLIDWVLLGPNGAPSRIPPEILGAFPVELPSFNPGRVTLPPTNESHSHQMTVARRDLDPMAHVNNSVYLDYLEEGVDLAGGADLLRHVPRTYRLEYALPAEPGARLVGRVGRLESGWTYRLSDEGGRELFRGLVESVGQSPRER